MLDRISVGNVLILMLRRLSIVAAIVSVSVLIAACSAGAKMQTRGDSAEVDLQGHRGARGLLPENTIPSFLKAVDLGVHTIELDVVMTADDSIVVSHEPWMSHEICSLPDGGPIDEAMERRLNIFEMSYAEVSKYDCGLRGNPRFPSQTPIAAHKPLLSDVIMASERRAEESGRAPIAYNIEIKSRLEGDGIFHPAPDVFAKSVYDLLASRGVLGRSTIQSFDPRALESVHRIDPTVTLALLVDNDDGLEQNLDRLSFRPKVYSPHQRLVDGTLVLKAHAMGIKVVPWTVNDEAAMRSLLDLGVDGLITDYPDVGKRVVEARR